MGKRIVELFAILLIACIGIGYYQSYLLNHKKEIREEALLYFDEEDYVKAIEYMNEAEKTTTMFSKELDEDIACYKAESYYQLGQYKQSIEIYNRLLKDNVNKKEYYILKGECYQGKGDLKKAISVFNEGWNQTGQKVFLNKICAIYLSEENYEEALLTAKKGMELDGDNAAEFMFETVIIYEKCSDYQSAYDMICKYCEKYPEDENAQKEKIFLSTRI